MQRQRHPGDLENFRLSDAVIYWRGKAQEAINIKGT